MRRLPFLVIALLILGSQFGVTGVHAQTRYSPDLGTSKRLMLPSGGWWQLEGTDSIHATDVNNGGTWDQQIVLTLRFAVILNVPPTGSIHPAIFMDEYYEYSTTTTVTRGWAGATGNSSSQSWDQGTIDYIIDTDTLRVTQVNSWPSGCGNVCDLVTRIGNYTWFLIDPTIQTDGGTAVRTFCVASNNSCSRIDVPYDVRNQAVNFRKGVLAWNVSYSGISTGLWTANSLVGLGPQTTTYFYDSAYGIIMTENATGNYALPGSLIERHERSLVITNTNLLYPLTVTSQYGDPSGSGLYPMGGQATVSVQSNVQQAGLMGILGGTVSFARWTEDITSTSPTATLTMDAPKTVRAIWSVNNSQPYVILAIIGFAIATIGVMTIKRLPSKTGRKKKKVKNHYFPSLMVKHRIKSLVLAAILISAMGLGAAFYAQQVKEQNQITYSYDPYKYEQLGSVDLKSLPRDWGNFTLGNVVVYYSFLRYESYVNNSWVKGDVNGLSLGFFSRSSCDFAEPRSDINCNEILLVGLSNVSSSDSARYVGYVYRGQYLDKGSPLWGYLWGRDIMSSRLHLTLATFQGYPWCPIQQDSDLGKLLCRVNPSYKYDQLASIDVQSPPKTGTLKWENVLLNYSLENAVLRIRKQSGPFCNVARPRSESNCQQVLLVGYTLSNLPMSDIQGSRGWFILLYNQTETVTMYDPSLHVDQHLYVILGTYVADYGGELRPSYRYDLLRSSSVSTSVSSPSYNVDYHEIAPIIAVTAIALGALAVFIRKRIRSHSKR